MIARRSFLKSAALLSTGLATLPLTRLAAQTTPQSKPNVVVILLDDTGYECFETLGQSEFRTPNITKFTKEAVTFPQCDAAPLSTPSRVKLMTGQHNFKNYERFAYLNPKYKTFGNLMRDSGYKTGVFGKWQMSMAHETREKLKNGSPQDFGFETYTLHAYFPGNTRDEIKEQGRRANRFYDPILFDNEGEVPNLKDQYGSKIVNDRALEFIDQNKDKPFFLYYPMMLAHWPFVTTPFTDKDGIEPDWLAPKDANARQNFKDMVYYADHLIGNIFKKLKEHNLYDNTLVIITSDNGTYPGVSFNYNSNTFYGGKSYPQFSGSRVPLIAKFGSKTLKPQVNNSLIDLADVLPTIADAANLTIPQEYQSNGQSFLPQVQNKTGNPKPYILCYYPSINIRAERRCIYVRNHDFKLYSDGRLYAESDREELNPIFPHDDTPVSSKARKQLAKALNDSYAKYPKLAEKRDEIIQEFKDKKFGLVIGSSFLEDREYYTQAKLDITNFIKSNGEYSFKIQQFKGNGDLYISDVKLLADGKEISKDFHLAKSLQKQGSSYIFRQKHHNTIFSLKVTNYNPNKTYTIAARIEQPQGKQAIAHFRLLD
ncbi:sulfatase-like hydrolase/transferase [Planctomycetota bacterium]|nr:sulfatase-like hydrolase/transferase [Planctomycetota bacterium]